eukprot:GFKZ01005374.1.p1 GENE.GFKZ01005374.1~~GFKZ01005374.1.p1  ORF type:complete len:2130 (-),score=277.76 GFKZ01005374.1:64-6453(-)
MVDYAPPWDAIPREPMHAAHEMSLSQVKKSAATLAVLLDENREEKVLREACLGLCQLFGEGIQNDRIQAILDADVVPKLVALLRPSKSRSVPITVQSAALQVLGNVACGDDRQTQVVINSNALPCLRALLSSGDRGIRKEVCWIVSNITESSHQVQDVLDADILPPLLKLLDNQDAACREDATWVLFNMSSNRDPNQIAYLAEKNGVRALCNLLNCSKELDVMWKGCGTVAAVALKGLRNILISGQIAAASDPNGYNKMASLVAEAHGVERIEALTTHVSHDVRTRARLLLERMFGAEPTTADLSPPLPPPAVTGLSSLSSPPPPPPLGHSGCTCTYSQHHQHSISAYHGGLYDVAGSLNCHAALHGACHLNHGISVEHGLPSHAHLHHDGDLVDVPGSSSGSSTDSDPEEDDSDSDLIPPPPAPCCCVMCTDPSPLAERRPRGKGPPDDSEFHKKGSDERRGVSVEVRQICDFCSGSGRLGDGRAGLAAKLGRAVRLGHQHCTAILLSRMTWSQRVAATEAPAVLHPGGGPPDGGVGSSFPAVVLAAQLGKPECLSLLLRKCRPDLDVTHGKKRLTALALAAHKGYLRCCQLLIEHGAKSSTKCGDGVTALHLAASGGGHIAICKLLISHKAPVNARSAKKQTPLFLAAQKGFVKVVQLLLEHGAEANIEDETKHTPLHLAASSGFVSCVDLLLKAGAHVNVSLRNGVTPLHYAVQNGHAQVVKLLITAGARVNCGREPLLIIAAGDGNVEVVQMLIDANATIDCKANFKTMLDKDHDVFDLLTPLHLGSSKGHHDVVELLLERGANVNEVTTKSGWSALDFSVLNAHAECAITLLKYGARVTDNCKTIGRNNWTLVQYAAHHQEKELVRLLIQRLKDQRTGTGTETNSSEIASEPATATANGEESFSSVNPPGGIPCSSCDLETRGAHSFRIDGEEADQSAYMPLQEHHGDAGHQQIDDDGSGIPSYRGYDPKSPDGDESPFIAGNGHVNGSLSMDGPSRSSRRRVVKEERHVNMRSRELKKREAEATEARDRLDEAISQRSVTKLTEAIAHVSKLVLHLATTVGGDVTSAGHIEHDMNGYSPHGDNYSHGGHVHSPATGQNKHSSAVSGSALLSAPLAMEVGLGNEVQKARKILAGLLAEEKRLREEKEKEVEHTKRENTQQTVRKAILAALEGGDPRSLSRVSNRAVRTILEKNDPIIIEATSLSSLISSLEKWENSRKSAVGKKDLDGLAKALPEISTAVSELKRTGGYGAAKRVFGGVDPDAALQESKELLKELEADKQSKIAKEAEAKHLEEKAGKDLLQAIESDDITELERALDRANSALLSKQSKLATTIESGKKLMAKRLKAERRKLRQASNTNDPSVIEEAAALAQSYGLQSLKGEIDSAKKLAEKLRKQADAQRRFEDATNRSDVSALTEIRGELNALGMFSEAERARAEVERLQRATRARTLLESAIEDAKHCQGPFQELLEKVERAPNDGVELQASWTWPNAQRLVDLSERARKYGQAMLPLCKSADALAQELAVLGRKVLALTAKSDDARGIAAVITAFEKAFVNVSKPDVFNAAASQKAVQQAKERLADVQAMDQASVKAESAQVKVEYALATSRRSAARNRGAKGSRPQAQGGTVGSGTASSSSHQIPNGSVVAESDTRSPSSLSSDFVDDDRQEPEMMLPGFMQADGGSLKANEGTRGNAVRRARTVSPTDDNLLLDGVGDVPAAPGECSHLYLFKEGTTVCCARCGHLRNSRNPEWLARVKRRGNAIPAELPNIPSFGSAPDLQAGFATPGPQVVTQTRSPPTLSSGGIPGERVVSRPSRGTNHGYSTAMTSNGRDGVRGPGAVGGRMNPHPGSLNIMAQLIQHQQQHHLQQHHFQEQQGSAHNRMQGPERSHIPTGVHEAHIVQRATNQSPGHHIQIPKNVQNHRGRPRGHLVRLPPALDGHGGGLGSMYNGGLVNESGLLSAGNSVGLPSNYGAASSMHSLGSNMLGGQNAQGGKMSVYGMGGSLTAIDVKGGVGLHRDMGVPTAVPQHALRVDAMGHAGQGLQIRNGGRVTMPAVPPASDELGISGPDLGLDFANENFGFDIDAIVDDNPPPRPSKPVGTHDISGRGDGGKTFVPRSLTQQNGYYRS